MRYDIIGDIHGCGETLKALLRKLGYEISSGSYRHADRQAIFLGDFIDRGPRQREVLEIVRPMIDCGSARAVMANHEFNAIAFATPHPSKPGHLREHSEKNCNQHRAFLDAYSPGSLDYAEMIEWFKTLPLWLDLGGIRIVHACWDPAALDYLSKRLKNGALITDELLEDACTKGSRAYEAVETILKGKEIPLPPGSSFPDKDGSQRNHIRIRWWDGDAKSHRDAFFGPASALTHIPDDPVDEEHLISYAHHEPPVFLGHYWLEGDPEPLAPNIACLDYSVAKPGGKLVAYQWDGEGVLAREKFESVTARD